MLFGIAIGLTIGALLLNLAVEEEQKISEKLKKIINILEEDLDRAIFKIECKDEKINDYQEEHEILLENASEARARITDLENNIELLINSLTESNISIIKELSSKFGNHR